MAKTKTIVLVKTLYLSICEASPWIGVTASRINININIIINKNTVITKH